MSPRRRPNWVQPDGDWIFRPHKVEFLKIDFKNNTTTTDRSEYLRKIGQTNIAVPEWWERGIEIKDGPDIKFRVDVIDQVPYFTHINILSNKNYPIISKEDLEEVTLNFNRLLTWAVREIAVQTKVLPDGSIDLTSGGIGEPEWELLSREVNRLTSRRDVTPDLLKRVSEVYIEAKNNKEPTTRAIQDKFRYSASRARNLVAIARKEGFLDPVKKSQNRGKKNEH